MRKFSILLLAWLLVNCKTQQINLEDSLVEPEPTQVESETTQVESETTQAEPENCVDYERKAKKCPDDWHNISCLEIIEKGELPRPVKTKHSYPYTK